MNALARHCVIPLALIVFAGAAAPQGDPHRIVQPDQLKWADVPSLPAGAKIAVIEGPMNEATPFTIRLHFPANYRIPPHIHPAVERVTVLSGTFHLAMGEKFDPAAGQAMPTGATAVMGRLHKGPAAPSPPTLPRNLYMERGERLDEGIRNFLPSTALARCPPQEKRQSSPPSDGSGLLPASPWFAPATRLVPLVDAGVRADLQTASGPVSHS